MRLPSPAWAERSAASEPLAKEGGARMVDRRGRVAHGTYAGQRPAETSVVCAQRASGERHLRLSTTATKGGLGPGVGRGPRDEEAGRRRLSLPTSLRLVRITRSCLQPPCLIPEGPPKGTCSALTEGTCSQRGKRITAREAAGLVVSVTACRSYRPRPSQNHRTSKSRRRLMLLNPAERKVCCVQYSAAERSAYFRNPEVGGRSRDCGVL